MLRSLFLEIFANYWLNNWRFSFKPMLWFKFCTNEQCFKLKTPYFHRFAWRKYFKNRSIGPMRAVPTLFVNVCKYIFTYLPSQKTLNRFLRVDACGCVWKHHHRIEVIHRSVLKTVPEQVKQDLHKLSHLAMYVVN
jgi:hypothetical protein